MKTTVELSDELLRRTRRLAKREGVPMRALLEDGLRQVLKQRETKPIRKFLFPTFGGDGLRDEFIGADWERIRDEIYRDRG